LTSKTSWRFIRESMSLYGYLQSLRRTVLGVTTIIENVNLVSETTRDLIFDKQIEFVLKEELIDFRKLTIDSTSVKANSCWPTDAKILTGLLMRVNRLGQKLHVFGREDFRKGWMPRRLKKMDKLKRPYPQLLKWGRKAAASLILSYKPRFRRVSMVIDVEKCCQ